MKYYYILIISIFCIVLSGCGKKNDLEESQKNIIDEEVELGESVDDTSDGEKKITNKSLISSTKNFEDVVKQPNEMVYYHNGESFTITIENKLFDDIITELKSIFTDEMSTYKSMNEFPDGLDQAKENNDFLELLYDEEIIIDVEGISSSIKEVKYKGLLFPLTGDYAKSVIFMPWRIHSPVGDLNSLDNLMKLLNELEFENPEK